MTRYTHGIATASWIDSSVHLQLAAGPSVPASLPKNDGRGPPPLISRTFFRACRGFRFANFLEVGIEIENGQVVRAGFTPDSTGYFSDSFMGHPSHAYTPKRTMTRDGDQWVFTQIVGARTVGQEEVGGSVGRAIGLGVATSINPLLGPLGRKVGDQAGRGAARAVTPFAPIWSELEVRLSPTGQSISRLKRWSIFPSLTYYEQQTQTPDTMIATLQQKQLPYGPTRYDAGQEAQKLWFASGWGMLRGGSLGPTHGNPWGIENDGKDRERRSAM